MAMAEFDVPGVFYRQPQARSTAQDEGEAPAKAHGHARAARFGLRPRWLATASPAEDLTRSQDLVPMIAPAIAASGGSPPSTVPPRACHCGPQAQACWPSPAPSTGRAAKREREIPREGESFFILVGSMCKSERG